MAADSLEGVRPNYRPEVASGWAASEAVSQITAVDEFMDLGGIDFDPAALPQVDGGPAVGGEQPTNQTSPSGLPLLHSNPGASHTIYLNFTGNKVNEEWITERGNLTGIVTKPFDMDGDPSEFDVNEQYMIRQIWEIVAEDYAPFDVDVTTDYAGPFGDGKALKVAIGETDKDSLITTGISRINGFADHSQIPAIVSMTNVRENMARIAAQPELEALGLIREAALTPTEVALKESVLARYRSSVDWETMVAIGNTASHESGHEFGLVHDRDLVGDGGDYNPGTATWTPIMGSNISTDRHTWSNPLVDSVVTETGSEAIYQNELDVLAGVLGMRADDHPDGYATPLAAADSGLQFDGSGMITTADDADIFSFQVQYDGVYHVAVDVPQFGNLDSEFELYSDGSLVGAANNFDQLSESGDFQLEAGRDYLLVVRSNGAYGDLGNYKASVTWPLHEVGPIAEMPPLVDVPEGDPAAPAEDNFGDPASQYIPNGSDDSIWDSVWGTVGANETPYTSYQQSNPVAVSTHVYDNVFSGMNATTFTKIGSYFV